VNQIGPLYDSVTWYKITHAGKEVAQWDFQNKGRSRWTGTSCIVLEAPLCNLLTSMCDYVPCDRANGLLTYNVFGVNMVLPIWFPVFVPFDQRSENESSGCNHFSHAPWMQIAQRNRMGRIRLFPLLFQNDCSQRLSFSDSGKRKRRPWPGNEIEVLRVLTAVPLRHTAHVSKSLPSLLTVRSKSIVGVLRGQISQF